MKNKLTIILICCFIISSCDNKPTLSNDQPEEITHPEKKAISVEEALLSDLSAWTEHWAYFVSDFSIEKFEKGEENELQDLSSDLIPEMKPGPVFQEKMIVSPGKSRYIDLYSYKMIIFSKEGELIGSINPDAEAVIIDPRQEIRNRILFMGPAGGIEDATWLSDEEILISGFSVDESGHSSPMLWHINLNNKTMNAFYYPVSTDYNSKAYLQKVFPQVKFD
ncbi:hypothetical protein BH23BAC1_BH23BAC1_15740 [soil metagenome]